MRYINIVSFLILGVGLVMAILGEAFDLDATITLVGLLLVIAGVIKVITVRIWHIVLDGEIQAGGVERHHSP